MHTSVFIIFNFATIIIKFIETDECKKVKIWAQNMINSPEFSDEFGTFWTELVNNWKRCEGGAF